MEPDGPNPLCSGDLVAAHADDAQELPHFQVGKTPLVRLVRAGGTAQILEQTVTEERILLPEGAQWSLAFHEGWGFLHAEGREPMWCSRLLRMSLWVTGQGAAFLKKLPENEDDWGKASVILLSEHERSYDIVYFEWDSGEGIVALPPGSKVYKMRRERSGARYYWQLVDIQDACKFTTPWCRSSTWLKGSIKGWAQMMSLVGVPGDHICRPFLRSVAAARGVQAQTWAVSSAALVWLLCHWASSLKDPSDAKRAHDLLRGLLLYGLGDCEIPINMYENTAPGVPCRGDDILTVKGCNLNFKGANENRFKTIFAQQRSLVDILIYAKRCKYKAIFSHLIVGIGAALDSAMDRRTLPRRSLEVLSKAPPRPGRRADRACRDEVAEITGRGGSRNNFRTTVIGGKLGLKVNVHKAWVDHAAQSRYLLACRRLFAGCTSFGVAPDKSRLAGRDWLGNSLYSPDVDRICWCAPQAQSGGP